MEFITIDELMKRLNIRSPSTIHRWVRQGIIRKYHPRPHSHMVYYDIDEILQNLKAKSENSAAP